VTFKAVIRSKLNS